MRALRRATLALVLVVAVTVPVLLTMVEVPEATAATTLAPEQAPSAAPGPVGVGVRELDLVPAVRTWIWYPAAARHPSSITYPYEVTIAGMLGTTTVGVSTGQATPDAPPDRDAGTRPLVIIEPGYGIGPRAYAWLAEHLASHGFVVVASERDGSLAGAVDGLWRSGVTRPRELQASLAAIRAWSSRQDPVARLVDTETVAVVGHSYGGYTALVAGGARLDTRGFAQRCADATATARAGTWLCDALLPHLPDMADLAGLPAVPDGLWPDWRAPAVDAVVSFAGDAYLLAREGLAELDVPVLAIGGTADVDTPYSWGTEPTFAHAGSPRRARAALQGAEHMVFTARCTSVRRIMTLVPFGFCDDTDGLREQRHHVIAHLTTTFLRAELTDAPTEARTLAEDRVRLPATAYDAQGY